MVLPMDHTGVVNAKKCMEPPNKESQKKYTKSTHKVSGSQKNQSFQGRGK